MRSMAIAAPFFRLRETRAQECHFVKAGSGRIIWERDVGRRFTIMASQTEPGPAAGPWFLTAGVRIDQTHNAATMSAIVMAQQAVVVLDRAGEVLGRHVKFSTRTEDLPATVYIVAGMTADTRIFPDIEIIVPDLPDVAGFTALVVFVMIITTAVTINTPGWWGCGYMHCIRAGSELPGPKRFIGFRFELSQHLVIDFVGVDGMERAGS